MPEPNPDWFFQPRSQTAGPAEDTGSRADPPPGRGTAAARRPGARPGHGGQRARLPAAPVHRVPVQVAARPGEPAARGQAGDVSTRSCRGGDEAAARSGGPRRGARQPDAARRMARDAAARGADRGGGQRSRPVTVDAWVALQALRAAAAPLRRRAAGPAGPRPAGAGRGGPDRPGAPARRLGHHRQPVLGDPAAASPPARAAAAGPRSTDSYLFSGGDTRTPVTVLLDPPERELPAGYGRRPVVAVLDTGVRAHPWLDVERRARGRIRHRSPPRRRRLHRGRPRHPEGDPARGRAGGSLRRPAAPGDQAPVGHAGVGGPADRRARPAPWATGPSSRASCARSPRAPGCWPSG